MAAHSGSRLVVYAALAGNFLIAVTKFVAAFFTGSSAMLSEGVHSLVDTGNEGLLLYGMHRSEQGPDRNHPLGHSRELYFWAFIVALLVFALGAGISFYEGVQHILTPEPMESVYANYIVLGLSMIFEGVSWTIAMRDFRGEKGPHRGWIEAMRRSKDPTTFTVLFEDSAALIGLVIALVGIFLAERLGIPELDGVASLGIAVVLALTAALLARETKGLLIGEAASPRLQQDILDIASADASVERANGIITVHMGPDNIVAALSADFDDSLTARDIEAAVTRIEESVRTKHPDITRLFIKPQTPGGARRAQARARGEA